jgi:hypothetical protein
LEPEDSPGIGVDGFGGPRHRSMSVVAAFRPKQCASSHRCA